MMQILTPDHVRAALALRDFDVYAAWARMELEPHPPRITAPAADAPARRAGVLVSMFPGENGALSLLLIQRTPDPGVHSGQVAFPGGSWEPGDADDTATALREACEEVGLCGPATILGQLTQLYIPPSRFLVTPTVAYLPTRPIWQPNPEEVAALFELPLTDLLDDSRKTTEDWTLFGTTYRVPFYAVDGQKVWGATAIMLSELEMRLKAVLNSQF